jgi:hypothetical protein
MLIAFELGLNNGNKGCHGSSFKRVAHKHGHQYAHKAVNIESRDFLSIRRAAGLLYKSITSTKVCHNSSRKQVTVFVWCFPWRYGHVFPETRVTDLCTCDAYFALRRKQVKD